MALLRRPRGLGLSGGWEVAPPAHPLHWRNLRHPLAMSPRVRTHREGHRPSLRAFLEKEVPRGQCSLSVSRGGIRRRCTLEHLCFSPTQIWVPSLMHLEGPRVNQPLALPWAAGGDPPTFPHRYSGHPGFIPGLSFPSAESLFYSFLSQGSCSRSQGQTPGWPQRRSSPAPPSEAHSQMQEAKTSSGLEATARGAWEPPNPARSSGGQARGQGGPPGG